MIILLALYLMIVLHGLYLVIVPFVLCLMIVAAGRRSTKMHPSYRGTSNHKPLGRAYERRRWQPPVPSHGAVIRLVRLVIVPGLRPTHWCSISRHVSHAARFLGVPVCGHKEFADFVEVIDRHSFAHGHSQ